MQFKKYERKSARHLHNLNTFKTFLTFNSECRFPTKAPLCKTHMGSVAEEVYPQLITHAIVTLVVGELDECDHFLDWTESFDPLLIILGFGYRLADLFETSLLETD